MTEAHEERLVIAFEQIARALTGIYDTQKKGLAKRWPERGEVREAVVTRVPTAEDLVREAHGASEESIEEWIGLREQEFIKSESTRAEAAGAQTSLERYTALPRR